MFNFTKKNKNLDNNKTSLFSKTASLLIHAAKMDESYTKNEKEIIKKTLIDLGVNSEEINKIMIEAEENEKNSNQILEFTKKVKHNHLLTKVSRNKEPKVNTIKREGNITLIPLDLGKEKKSVNIPMPSNTATDTPIIPAANVSNEWMQVTPDIYGIYV